MTDDYPLLPIHHVKLDTEPTPSGWVPTMCERWVRPDRIAGVGDPRAPLCKWCDPNKQPTED